MGTDDREGFADDGEGPVREVLLSPFAIDTTAVTNADFAAFVEDTGYRTEAVGWGWSYVFAGFLPAAIRKVSPRPPATPWWCAVRGADWCHPEGPGSDAEERLDHPVVHVSWADAAAYAAWAGGRLPTEAEWEYAARGGLAGARYPWGDELTPEGRHRCNIWQGTFPVRNTAADGHRGTAPVRSFAANGYGLYEVAGNVWEWTADWWRTDHDSGAQSDPVGPGAGTAKVMRGGSYLCHASYCNRYRVAARSRNDPDSSSGNQGFRCAYDAADRSPDQPTGPAPR
jgi:formylglycine-generating enzyme required for sulfatase activity